MDLNKAISQLQSKRRLNDHSLIRRMKHEVLTREQVAIVLGQWFHPLHYFPSFVSRYIGICQDMATKTLMSKIVWQELGEGDVKRAHETIFIDTMTGVGFDKEALAAAEAFPATARLVAEYRAKSANDHLASLGYVYATESADLLMVSSIGTAVRNATGIKRLPWVDIHIIQEPDHNDSVDGAVSMTYSDSENEQILAAADAMFECWCDFFNEIEMAIGELKAAA